MNGGGWFGLEIQIATRRQRDCHSTEKRQPPIKRRMGQGWSVGSIAIHELFAAESYGVSQRKRGIVEIAARNLK